MGQLRWAGMAVEGVPEGLIFKPSVPAVEELTQAKVWGQRCWGEPQA